MSDEDLQDAIQALREVRKLLERYKDRLDIDELLGGGPEESRLLIVVYLAASRSMDILEKIIMRILRTSEDAPGS